MSSFSIRNPYFIIVLCLSVTVPGIVAVARMPVDLFPPIDLLQFLVAQFGSFIGPVLILLAIPVRIIGVLVILFLTGTTLDVMSPMGLLMLVGIAASNSILIADFAHRLLDRGLTVTAAAIFCCRVRLRPILMTSLATIIGMIPMALKTGTGSERYAPMAEANIGGLSASIVLTVFIVPAAYMLIYRRRERILPALAA